MRLLQSNEFVLAKDANGRHYEEFCGTNEAERLLEIIKRALCGRCGGHDPKPGEAYAGRVYGYKDRILVKQTRRRMKSIRR